MSETVKNESIEVKKASFPSWFSEEGIALKRIALIAKGFPMPLDWVMITLTCDPAVFNNCPKTAYRKIMDSDNSGTNNRVNYYMRKIVKKLIEWGYFTSAKTVCHWRKLEFQTNEFPHWHIYLNLTEKLSKDQLRELCDDWKFGKFVNFTFQKKGSNPYYVFKYAFKSPLKRSKFDSDGRLLDEFEVVDCALPDWFADAYWKGQDGKNKSYHRARFFQTSRNFYDNFVNWCSETGQDADSMRFTKKTLVNAFQKEEPEEKDQLMSFLPIPLRLAISRQFKRIQVISRDANGRYQTSKTILLNKPFRHFEKTTLIPALLKGDAITPHRRHYTLRGLPENLINKNNQIDLCQLQQKNQRTFEKSVKQLDLSISQRLNKASSVLASLAMSDRSKNLAPCVMTPSRS